MKCTYCLKEINNDRSDDHVFPFAWYPDSTPANLERWTVPACRKCNAKFQIVEDKLFIRWGICVDPNLEACRGIGARARRRHAFTEARNPRSFGRKLAAFKDVTSRMGHFDPKRTYKGFSPKEGIRGTRAVITPNVIRRIFSEKLVRGTEYKLLGRLISWKKRIEVYYEMADDKEEDYATWRHILSRGRTVSLGPGFVVKYAVNRDHTDQSLYQFEIWGHIKFFAFVYTKSIRRELVLVWYSIKGNSKRILERILSHLSHFDSD